MKSNRQIGLDGRVFILDCLTDSIFFVYSIILCGILSAVGDIMKLLGTSSRGMDEVTNGVIIFDLVCSLGMVVVAYYVYFMNCGENVPKLGNKPLIYLEYVRLGYYGMLAYFVVYRMVDAWHNCDTLTAAVPIFYLVYLAWIVTCILAAMFLLTLLHQNIIRRSYEHSFKMLALVGLGINILLPLVYIVTRIWVRGAGDGFYSAGLCDFVRLCVAPVFYCALWFIYMNAIDQVHKVFDEVDSAIRDKRYHIEFEENEQEDSKGSKKNILKSLKEKTPKEKKPKKHKEKKQKAEKTKQSNKSKSDDEAVSEQSEPIADENDALPESVADVSESSEQEA